MKLDFAIFEPNEKQAKAIRAIVEFWHARNERPFTTRELTSAIKASSTWVQDKYSMVALGDLLLLKNKGKWTCESLMPQTAHYYALRVLQEATATFGDRVVPSDNKQFIAMVYDRRLQILGKKSEAEPNEIQEFVKERLSRCGLETFRADIGSIAELWDIFDDLEFQKLMGRRY